MGFTGPLEDRLAIRELIDDYNDAVARFDAEAWGDTWTDDAEWARKRSIVSDAAEAVGRNPVGIENAVTIETPLPETDAASAELLDEIGRRHELGVHHFVMDFGHPLSPEPILRFEEQVMAELRG